MWTRDALLLFPRVDWGRKWLAAYGPLPGNLRVICQITLVSFRSGWWLGAVLWRGWRALPGKLGGWLFAGRLIYFVLAPFMN